MSVWLVVFAAWLVVQIVTGGADVVFGAFMAVSGAFFAGLAITEDSDRGRHAGCSLLCLAVAAIYVF